MSKLRECLADFCNKVVRYKEPPNYSLDIPGRNYSLDFDDIYDEKCYISTYNIVNESYNCLLENATLSDIRPLLIGLKLNHLITEKALVLMFEAEGI